MKRLMLIFISTLVCVGCMSSQVKYKQTLQRFLGITHDQLVDEWGYPTETMELVNGNVLYVYKWSGVVQKTVSDFGNTIEVYYVKPYCNTYFEINTKLNMVVGYSADANTFTQGPEGSIHWIFSR